MPADKSTPKGRQGPRRSSPQAPGRRSQTQPPSQRSRVPERGSTPASRNRWFMFGGGAVAVVLIAVAAFQLAPHGAATATPSGEPAPGTAINSVSCEAEMTQYHYHAALVMYMNGNKVDLPPQVGQPYNKQITAPGNTCLYWMHTHSFDSTEGIVHIESPTQRTFTVGEFFDIWHYTAEWDLQSDTSYKSYVDPTFVNAARVAPLSDIHTYVNGKPYSGDYRKIVFHAHDVITIELGKPLRPPTKSIVFPSGE
jgi:hypothetical protein